jgi:hypothetical protein
MNTLSPHLSITLSQRRWACVLDPNLLLSQYGLFLVQSLREVLELWIARELWHILDNPSFYLAQPELGLSQTDLGLSSELPTIAQQKRVQMLKGWESLRIETPVRDLNLFWIGDRPTDSFLPNGTHPYLTEHWEVLARSLDQRLQEQSLSCHMMVPAFRDTAALAAVLGSAFILTYQPVEECEKNTPPQICQVLEQWGIPCQQIDSLDAIADIERKNLLQLMISTGFSKFLWAGLHLVVLHLVVPSAFRMGGATQSSWCTPFGNEAENLEALPLNFWEGAKGFWYRL